MTDIIKPIYGDIWANAGEKLSPESDKIAMGWIQEMMPYQYENFLQNRTDVAISYLLQKGIPEWSAEQEYIANKSVVTYSGQLYLATATSSNVLPTVTASWRRLTLTFGANGAIPVAFGGTGATNAADARTNLGIGSAATVNLPASNGVVVKLADNSLVARTIAGTSGYITVTNGDGVAGNPTINVGANVAKTDQDTAWTTKTSIKIPSGTTAERGTGAPGRIRFNIESGVYEGHDSTGWSPIGSNGTMDVQDFQGDGTTTSFTLSSTPRSENNTQVFFNGIYQQKNSYELEGNILVFDEAPATDISIEVVTIASVAIGTTTAAQTSIIDSGDYYLGNNVEVALSEAGRKLKHVVLTYSSVVEAEAAAATLPDGQTVEAGLNRYTISSGTLTNQRPAEPLRTDLAATGGAGLVGVSSGGTVEQELSSVRIEVSDAASQAESAMAVAGKAFSDQSNFRGLHLSLPLKFDGYEAVCSANGYEGLVPQAFCEFEGDLYITYYSYPEVGQRLAWQVRYDWKTGQQKGYFSAGNGAPEGLVILRETGRVKLYTRGLNRDLLKYDITSVQDGQVLVKESTHLADKLGAQFSYFNGTWYTTGLDGEFNLIQKYDSAFAPAGQIQIKEPLALPLSNNTNYFKRQSLFVNGRGITLGIGGYALADTSESAYTSQGYAVINGAGDVEQCVTFSHKGVISTLRSLGVPATRQENEGCLDFEGHIYSMSIGSKETDSGRGVLTIFKEAADGGEDFSSARNFYAPVIPHYPLRAGRDYLPSATSPISDAMEVARWVSECSVSEVTVYVGQGAEFTMPDGSSGVVGAPYGFLRMTSGSVLCFGRGNRDTRVFGIYSVGTPQESVTNPLFFTATSIPSVAPTNAVVAGLDGIGRIDFFRNQTSDSERLIFRNPNGIVGRVVTSGSQTNYITTSDATLKDFSEEEFDSQAFIKSLLVRRAVAMARFKSAPSSDFHPMFVAQSLHGIRPDAVSVGGGESPWGVDGSKLIPALVFAIGDLLKRVEDLENKG